MPRYLLHHRHDPADCGAVFASFKGGGSPLRHRPALASCLSGDHSVWWTVDAAGQAAALGLLPAFVATRTVAIPVSDVDVP
jgi:hypothetical protein